MNIEKFLPSQVKVASPDRLAETVVLWLEKIATDAVKTNGECHVALSGGSTPKAIYQLMASENYAGRFEWNKMKFYFGDERTVPHDHPDSNYKMAMDALLSRVPIPSENIFAINTNCKDFNVCAAQYQQVLKQQLPVSAQGFGQFDVVFLGMGEDGHTASLFPGTDILSERKRWVSAVYVQKLETWRISITFPLINHAYNVAFIVAGENKAEKIREILAQKVNQYPIEKVSPRDNCVWFLDSNAAKLIVD